MPMKLRSATRIHNSAGDNVVKIKEVVSAYKMNELVSLRQHYGIPQGSVTPFQALLCVVNAERERLRELEDEQDAAGGTTETKDGIYGVVDESAVALGNVYNSMESNGVLHHNKTIDDPKVSSSRCKDKETEDINKPEPVQSVKQQKPRVRTGRSNGNKRPAGPSAEAKIRKDRGKERATDATPSDEATGKPTRSGGDVDEVAVHPPKISRPRVRLLVRTEKYDAAATISRQAKGESRADETTPPPLVVPDGMREPRRRMLVSTETPIPHPRIRRQPEALPVMGKGKMKGKTKEQQKRGNKRTRRDFEDDDAPEDSPPGKRTEQAHNLEGATATTSSNFMA